jgi:hypothetical protein
MKLLFLLIIIVILIVSIRVYNLSNNNSNVEYFSNKLLKKDEHSLEIFYDEEYLIFKPSTKLRNDLSVYTIYIEDLHDSSKDFQVIRFVPPQNQDILTHELNEDYNCESKEVWHDVKTDWCCKHKGIGCESTKNNTKPIEIRKKLKTLNPNLYYKIYSKCNYLGYLIESNVLLIPPKNKVPKYDPLSDCNETLNKYPDEFAGKNIYTSILL